MAELRIVRSDARRVVNAALEARSCAACQRAHRHHDRGLLARALFKQVKSAALIPAGAVNAGGVVYTVRRLRHPYGPSGQCAG